MQKTPESYEYYVHFENIDKRNDCWLPAQDIQQTKDPILDEKKSQILPGDLHPNDNPHYGLSSQELQIHLEITKIKTIEKIRLGAYEADTWYFSPYPPQYHNIGTLYICEFCLNFYARESELIRHDHICPLFHPPGDQIYRDEKRLISIFEIDGEKNPVYCQNLGYLSKLFLDHKSLRNDMSIFLFYILCQIKDNQYHIAGYFSKVKDSSNNLSCILVLPFYQRKGYGKLLINFSYELSLIDGKIGGPEKPLSDLGRETYLSFWLQRIAEAIVDNCSKKLSIELISRETGIAQDDVKWSLAKCNIIKYSKGQNYICLTSDESEQLFTKIGRPVARIMREKIHYVPYRKSWEDEEGTSKSAT